jgi:SPP1 family predicted phage head-tail adaptor
MTTFTSLLNNIFAAERRVHTPDAQGGWVTSYIAIAPIRGRLRPASSTEIVAAQQEQRTISHIFYCEAGEDIARGDRITGDDITVDIMAIREPSRADHHLEIDCLETQTETSAETGS